MDEAIAPVADEYVPAEQLTQGLTRPTLKPVLTADVSAVYSNLLPAVSTTVFRFVAPASSGPVVPEYKLQVGVVHAVPVYG